jgi:ribosomal protein S16
MWSAEQWDQHNQEVRDKDAAQARANAVEEEHRRKQGGSSSSGDGELLGVLIVVAGYGIYKGVQFLGKAAAKGGEAAIKGGKLASKTAANAYKLHKGDIEIVSRDNAGNIIEKEPGLALTEPQENSTFSKREKVKEWIGKGVKKSKSASELITSAYKLTTSTTEIVSTDEEGKQKVIIKAPEANRAITIQPPFPFIYENHKYGEVHQDIIKTLLTYKLTHNFNNKFYKQIIKITGYRNLTFTIL